MNDVLNEVYNPDVLECIANLSNDEVFTPPEVANAMLDLLPQELFSNPNTKFLDPACKSGVFLREIAKRLLVGLEKEYPDLQSRVNHIFKNQLYGIAITELTSLLSRRSVYCCKYADNKYSVTKFDTLQGNIFFEEGKHLFIGGKCLHCGIGEQSFKEQFSDKEEKHAYQFIHNLMPGELENMKFDVIIGNPPYQMSDGGGGQGASASPIYHYFVETAKKLTPKYLVMITPSKWFSGGKNLDAYRKEMLNDKRIKEIHDYLDAGDCFPGVEIAGGVSYFLWERDYIGDCDVYTISNGSVSHVKRPLLEKGSDVFIRFNDSISIYKKVASRTEKTFSEIVGSRNIYNLKTDYKGHSTGNIKCYISSGYCYTELEHITGDKSSIEKYKVYVSYANGSAMKVIPYSVISVPFLGNPKEICSDTYLEIGSSEIKEECLNIISYMKTKFFRFLLSLKKCSPVASKQVYSFIPLQDFSKPWTDAELYEKYQLSQEEIDFIESMIRPME